MNLGVIKNLWLNVLKEYYFHKDKREYEKLAKENNVSDFKIYRKNYFKFRCDRFNGAGDINKHYFWQCPKLSWEHIYCLELSCKWYIINKYPDNSSEGIFLIASLSDATNFIVPIIFFF